MMFRHTRLSLSLVSGALLFFVWGCGRDSEDFPMTPGLQRAILAARTETVTSSQQATDALPRIIKSIEQIKTRLDKIELSPAAELPTPPVTAPKAVSTPSPSTPTQTQPSALPAAKPTARPVSPSAEARGQTELDKIKRTFEQAGSIQATVDRTEKSLSSGKVSTNKLTLTTRKPNLVKIEVIQSSTSAPGTKLVYNSGAGDKVKVRPGGALSFVTTELAKSDERLVSVNQYSLDNVDFFGVYRRLATVGKAELIGTTSLNGSKLNVLKLTPTGTHPLDSRIAYEYLGYEPQSGMIRTLEIYDGSGSKEPFYRLVLSEVKYLEALPDSAFTL
jgi:hypothetical protein